MTRGPQRAAAGCLGSCVPQVGIKMTNEPPKGLRNNVMGSYTSFTDDFLDKCEKAPEFKKLLFALCFFHAVIQVRSAAPPPQPQKRGGWRCAWGRVFNVRGAPCSNAAKRAACAVRCRCGCGGGVRSQLRVRVRVEAAVAVAMAVAVLCGAVRCGMARCSVSCGVPWCGVV